MSNTQFTQAAQSETGLLIRKPIREVFEAFVNPELTTQFWGSPALLVIRA